MMTAETLRKIEIANQFMKANPDATIKKACDEAGLSFGQYYAWKRQTGASPKKSKKRKYKKRRKSRPSMETIVVEGRPVSEPQGQIIALIGPARDVVSSIRELMKED